MSITNSLAKPPSAVSFGALDQGQGLREVDAPQNLSMSRFEAALERAKSGVSAPDPAIAAQAGNAQPGLESFRTAQLNTPANQQSAPRGVETTGSSPEVDGSQTDRTRALRGLDLSKDASVVDQNTTGQGILDGLSKLRSVFDNQENAINSISTSSVTDSTGLINLQLEVVKYSMLMDVTSKLTGKATQSFDTLMKGQ